MLSVRQENENQNPSAAPTLGMSSGVLGQGVIPGQGREVSSRQKGSGRFTNLQSYIRANEPESGGLNPNAWLVQQRAEQAGSQLGQRQFEFTGGVERVGTGLQGIQERANLAQSAFQDPTKFVQSPENLKRFTALRTGQENIPGVTETYGQIEPLRLGLASEQRNIAEGLRTDVGQNLQNYIRSQRANPSLATLGEMQLDRFLTEQTPTGQAAIESAVKRAGQIESEQTPAQERLAQLETLRSQLAENPLVTQAGILNRLGTERSTTEQNIRNINPGFLAEKMDLNVNQALDINNQINNYSNNINNLENRYANSQSRLNNLENAIGFENSMLNNPGAQQWQKESARANINTFNRQKEELQRDMQNINNDLISQKNELSSFASQNQNTIDKYNSYLGQLNKTKQEILSQYDPATLARIQAIGQLAGRGFEDTLGGRLT